MHQWGKRESSMKNWYVLNIKPKMEFQVERLFKEVGFEIYNPKFIQSKHVQPFFIGYEFIRFEYPAQYRLVKYTRGVKNIIGNEAGPIPVPEKVINTVKAREINGLIELCKYGSTPEVGDEIEVMEGPLIGLKGIFKKEISQRERALILLNFLSYQGQLVIEKRKIKKLW